jgi:glycosyltransferase involved in cell wall biosynthesis
MPGVKPRKAPDGAVWQAPGSASLILCTRNGGQRLQNCLQAIEAMEPVPSFEVIIVDNGSDDAESIASMRAFAETSRHSARLVTEPAPGNGAGRNAGITASRGELLVFIDDDCYPAPDLVRKWLDVFQRPGLGYGTGRVLPHGSHNRLPGFFRDDPQERVIEAGRFVLSGFMQGSNMAFSRACVERGGAFDPRFGSGVLYAGEDWEIAVRASYAGFTGGYFPGPTVSHDHGRTAEEAAARMDYYCFGTGAGYAKIMTDHWRLDTPARFLLKLRQMPQSMRKPMWAGFRHYLKTSWRKDSDPVAMRSGRGSTPVGTSGDA